MQSKQACGAAGQSRNFYLNHALMSGGGQRRINLTPGPWSPGADFLKTQNPGLVVTAIKDESKKVGVDSITHTLPSWGATCRVHATWHLCFKRNMLLKEQMEMEITPLPTEWPAGEP